MPLLNIALIIDYTAPILIEAFLNALIMECTTSIRLSNTSIRLHWLNPCSNALVMLEVIIFAASTTSTLVTDLVHCADVFLVDALLRKAVM